MASSFPLETDDSVSWTGSLRATFPWLKKLSSGMSILRGGNNNDMPDYIKLEEIQETLNGNHHHHHHVDEKVNLQQLRELCLQKGGLISHALRKRVWPKLVGAHQDVLLHSSSTRNADTSTTPSSLLVVEVTQQDLHLLQEDVAQPTMWNIEDYVWKNQSQQKKVTFLPGLEAASPTGSLDSIPRKAEEESGTMSPITITPSSTMYTSTKFPTALLRSVEEEAVLTNTLVGLLRTRPPHQDDDNSMEDRFHYYHGLQDLASLLLINLESPSLTCLILQKLAGYSLRDYMRGPANNNNNNILLSTVISALSQEILVQVDPTLYSHLNTVLSNDSDIVISKIYLKWIPSWFVSSVTTEELASRLVDVLLVSHPTMPIYVAVALTIQYRFKLLEATSPVSLERILKHLPKRLLQEANAMEVLEDVIATSIEYIRLYPPQSLVNTPNNNSNTMLTAPPPSWAIACQAPTDWALLQQAKALRVSGSDNKEATSAIINSNDSTTIAGISFFERRKYPLSTAAMGLSGNSRAKTRRNALVVVVVVVLVLLVSAGIATLSFRHVRNQKGILVSKTPPTNTKKSKIVPWKLHIATSNMSMALSNNNNKKNKKARMAMSNKKKKKTTATAAPSRRAIFLSHQATTDVVPAQDTTLPKLVFKVKQSLQKANHWKRNHLNRQEIARSVETIKEWKRNHVNRQEFTRLATIAIAESSYYRWKGQRFLI